MRRLALVFAVVAVAGASSAQAGDRGAVTGSVLVNPLSVDITFPIDPIKSGRWFQVTAQVANAGSTPLDKVQVTLVRPAQMNLDRAATQAIPQVPARGSKPVKWQACSNTPATTSCSPASLSARTSRRAPPRSSRSRQRARAPADGEDLDFGIAVTWQTPPLD